LTFQPAVGQQSEVVLFLLLGQRSGTACELRRGSRHTCSAAATKLFDSEWHISSNFTVVLAIVLAI